MVMVKMTTFLISSLLALVLTAADTGDIQNAWKTFLPVNQQKPSVEDLLWLEGDWKLVGTTLKPQKEEQDYAKIEHIEILKVPCGVKTNATSGAKELAFAATAFGKYDKGLKREVIVYPTLGYYAGSFCLGYPGQADAFELRKEAKSTPNAFVIRHEITGDTLLFQRAKERPGSH